MTGLPGAPPGLTGLSSGWASPPRSAHRSAARAPRAYLPPAPYWATGAHAACPPERRVALLGRLPPRAP